MTTQVAACRRGRVSVLECVQCGKTAGQVKVQASVGDIRQGSQARPSTAFALAPVRGETSPLFALRY